MRLPAAFLRAVRCLAFTTALTVPDVPSRTTVLAGSPRSLTANGAAGVGTDTTFTAAPIEAMLEGMNRAMWLVKDSPIRCGCCISEWAESTVDLDRR